MNSGERGCRPVLTSVEKWMEERGTEKWSLETTGAHWAREGRKVNVEGRALS